MSTAATASTLSTSTSPWDHPVGSSRRQKTAGAPSARTPATPGFMASPTVTASSPRLGVQGATTTMAATASSPSAPSPNYFAIGRDPTHRTSDSPAALDATPAFIHAVAAMSPQLVRADPRSEFETFRRQSDPRSFTLGQSQPTSASKKTSTPTSLRGASAGSGPGKPVRVMAPPPRATDPMDLDSDPVQGLSRTESPGVLGGPRYDSPANLPGAGGASAARPPMPSADDHHGRLSMPSMRPHLPSATASEEHHHHHSAARAATLPPRVTSNGVTPMVPSDLAALLNSRQDVFLLDVRVHQQFARARITGALNLCIPSTLLKRPSFNLRKLADTFTDPATKARFEKGRSSGMIVVYDDRSSSDKEAVACVSTLKKFTNEGWSGRACMLHGGFAAFSKQYPQLVEEGEVSASPAASATSKPLSLPGSDPATAPLAGGCPMPTGPSAMNPFFGNIRQNTDLIGGVGQIHVRRPSNLGRERASALPRWLATATDERDQGKAVANRFLQIERDEQRRMQEALLGGAGGPSSNATSSSSRTVLRQVKIAGIEEGTKNRYNNIWPYDHARVKLQDRSEGLCDYINASHIKAPWSNKRYIATQGPMPATFRDFWNLVWEQDVRVIVMLTAEHEGGQLKCHQYWSGREFGPLRLKPISEKKVSLEPFKAGQILSPSRRRSSAKVHEGGMLSPTSPTTSTEPVHAVVRTFSLSHASHPFMPIREITQLQLASWLDFDAPAHPAHVLNLIEQCDAVVRASTSSPATNVYRRLHSAQQHHLPFPANPRPVLVHCSAGCGRTGTFCTIDSVLDMLRRQKVERERRRSDGGGGGRKPTIPSPAPLEPHSPLSSDDNAHETDDDDDGDENKNQKIGKEGKEWVFDDDVDLVASTVDHLRSQRISMVQSLRQYVLCYEAVLEWLAEQDD